MSDGSCELFCDFFRFRVATVFRGCFFFMRLTLPLVNLFTFHDFSTASAFTLDSVVYAMLRQVLFLFHDPYIHNNDDF